MDQTKGEKRSSPQADHEEEYLIYQLNNVSFLAETKTEIMQHAVANCLKVCISAHGIQIPSLLDSSSKVTLLWQSYSTNHQKLNQQQVRRLTLTTCLS